MRAKDIIKILGQEDKTGDFIDFEVKGVSCHSRSIATDYCFIAVRGSHANGCEFVRKAVEKGARVVVYDKSSQRPEVLVKDKQRPVFIAVENTRQAMGLIAAAFFKEPAKKLKIIGITGTNGKTTTSFLVEHILKVNKINTGVIGTINYKVADLVLSAPNTTPDAITLQYLFRQMVDHNLTHAVMEVSSHALDQSRIYGIDFRSAIFTNLTHDHLDYHLDKENYFAAKAKLFKMLSKNSNAIINVDDKYGRRLKKMTAANIIEYAIDNKSALVRAENIVLGLNSSKFRVVSPYGNAEIETSLIGRHNVYNILGAICAASLEGLNLESIAGAVKTMNCVPGRLERVPGEHDFEVFIDYAHTEDALKNVLDALREMKPNKIITVFGCGGDRDKKKRPLMGRVTSLKSDFVIITNDNSRSEAPETIVEEIKAGFAPDFRNYSVVLDRKEAIAEALGRASKKDFVLIAGKGHENYQIFKDKTIDFDDKKIAMEILNRNV